MRLSINVGLSRKASKDYQSTGYSINVTAELDQSLLARPEELQQQIDALYQQAGTALDRQVHTVQPQPQPSRHDQRQNGSSNGARRTYSRGNGSNGGSNHNANGGHGYRRQDQPNVANNGQGGAPSNRNGDHMTDSQRRAINAIAHRLSMDAAYEVREIFGWTLDELTLKQASEAIDHLKGLQNQGANGGNGGGQ